jgi:ribosomal protein S18
MLYSKAESTTIGYSKSFQKWKKFAEGVLDVQYLPADPFHVALYLQHLSDTSSIAAVNSIFYAINWAHSLAGFVSPTQDQFLVAVRAGIIKHLSQGHPNKKEPLDIEHLKKLGAHIDYKDLTQLRNYVMFVLSFAAFLRRS